MKFSKITFLMALPFFILADNPIVPADRDSSESTISSSQAQVETRSVEVTGFDTSSSYSTDAEGVEGMSGTKLRGLAQSGDFDQFKTGLASKLNDNDKKKIYNIIRTINSTYSESIEDDILPFTEQHVGSNNITYRTIYYLAQSSKNKVPSIDKNNKLQCREISSIGFYNYDTIVNKLFRDYDIEKKKNIKNIHKKILDKFNENI